MCCLNLGFKDTLAVMPEVQDEMCGFDAEALLHGLIVIPEPPKLCKITLTDNL